MIDHLYKRLPGVIRQRLDQTALAQIQENALRDAEAIEATIPRVDLEAKHIQNLQIYIDRTALLAALPKKGLVAEIGVAEGGFSQEILAATLPTELHLIDSWSHDHRYINLRETIEKRFAIELAQKQIFIHQGFSTDQLKRFDDNTFDWLYLDTGHEYEMTVKELELCRTKVKPGGIIAGHDYVTGYWLGRVRYGVIEAIHEFCVNHNWEMIGLTHETHRHLSYALREIAT